MANLINQLNEAELKLKRLELAIMNKRVSTRMAKLARSIVYRRTKSGKGATVSANKPLKKLSTSYKLQRSGKLAFRTWRGRVVPLHGVDDRPRQLGKYFAPNKSNLTYTGQMLESIIINAGRYSFNIEIPPTKRQYQKGQLKGIKRRKEKGEPQVTNADVAGWVQENGRPFFALSKGELRIIITEYEKIIRQLIRKEGL